MSSGKEGVRGQGRGLPSACRENRTLEAQLFPAETHWSGYLVGIGGSHPLKGSHPGESVSLVVVNYLEGSPSHRIPLLTV